MHNEYTFSYFNDYLKRIKCDYKIKKGYSCINRRSKEIISEAFIVIKYIYRDWRYKKLRTYGMIFSIVCCEDEIETWGAITEDTGSDFDNMLSNGYLSLKVTIDDRGKLYIKYLDNVIRYINDAFNYEMDQIVYNEKNFIELIKLYVEYELKKAIDEENIGDTTTGWHNGQYLGITENCIDYVLSSQLFDGYFCERAYDDDEEIDIREDAERVFSVVENNPELLIILTYGFMAVGNYFFRECERIKFEDKFMLCICGRNKELTVNSIANIFINVLGVNLKKYNSIDRKSENINISSVKFRPYEKFYIADIPIMVYSKNGVIHRNQIVKNIMCDFLDDKIRFYPVFLSTSPLNIQECVDVNIMKMKNISVSGEGGKKLRKSVNTLYIEFIKYIQMEMEKQYERLCMFKYDKIKIELDKIKEEMQSKYNIGGNTEEQYYQLYTYMYLFWFFLKENKCIEIGNKCIEIMKSVFPMIVSCSELSLNDELSPLVYFRKYLEDIFINKVYIPNYIFFEGTEKMDGEYCYYLEGIKYYNDFLDKYPVRISKSEFNKLLKYFDIIKYRNGRSITLKRNYEKNKSINCLVVRRGRVGRRHYCRFPP